MKPNWDAQIANLKTAKSRWDASFVKFPDSLPIDGNGPNQVSKTVFNQAIADCISLLEVVNKRDDIDPLMISIHQNGVLSHIDQITNALNNAVNSPDQGQMSLLRNSVWGIRSSLAWLTPRALSDKMEKRIRDANFGAQMSAAEDAAKKIVEKASEIDSVSSKAIANSTNLDKVIDVIRGFEREASNAKINAHANATTVSQQQQAIEATLKKLTDGESSYQELLKNITALSNRAEETLHGASRVGLASSFALRKTSLASAQRNWAGLFCLGIIALILLSVGVLGKIIPMPVDVGNPYINLLVHLGITAPIIWFTWFCARQYGYATRLVEDYAFKEAAAMAFIGYREEMSGDTEMLKKLQDYAIKNFGANPIRMLSKGEPGSPVHDLLDKVIEKGGVDKGMEFAIALLKRKK